MGHEELDFIREGAGLERGVVHGGVCGADDDAAVPGDGEEDAAVVGLGDHDGGVAGEEFAREDEVDALAGGDDGVGGGIVHAADVIDEDAGGIDDAAGADLVLAAAFDALGLDADDVAVFFEEAAAAGVIEDDGAVIDGGAGEVDGEAGVIELAVVIDDAAVEAVGFEGGEEGDHLLAGEVAGGLEAELSGEGVVNLHADAVEGALPPVVAGDDEGEAVDEVGGIADEEAALAEGLEDEGDIALLEVADAAVDELGGAGGGAFGEVGLLDEDDGVAAGGGIDCGPEAGGSAADDRDVEGAGVGGELREEVFAVHGFEV